MSENDQADENARGDESAQPDEPLVAYWTDSVTGEVWRAELQPDESSE